MPAESADQKAQPRRIRSFVRRAGRITRAQQRALDELWPKYGIDYADAPLDLDAVFGRQADRILEIGFGNGDLLVELAAAHPDTDYLGVEVHEPGVGHCLLRIEEQALSNVRLISHDAIDVLKRQIPDDALQGVHLFFPDPWPKKRQHKRRIVQPGFVSLLYRKIRAGGYFHVATDWENYAEHIAETLADAPGFKDLGELSSKRPETRFELRGKRLGHQIWDRIYERT